MEGCLRHLKTSPSVELLREMSRVEGWGKLGCITKSHRRCSIQRGNEFGAWAVFIFFYFLSERRVFPIVQDIGRNQSWRASVFESPWPRTEVLQLKAFRMIVWWPGCWKEKIDSESFSGDMTWPAHHRVDGRNPAAPGMYETMWKHVNMGNNYQPQLVSRISSINSIEASRQLFLVCDEYKYVVWPTLWYSLQGLVLLEYKFSIQDNHFPLTLFEPSRIFPSVSSNSTRIS